MEKERNKYEKEYELIIEDCLKRAKEAKKEGKEIPKNFFDYLKNKKDKKDAK